MLESLSQLLGLACAESGRSVFSRMATRRNPTDRNFMELILEHMY